MKISKIISIKRVAILFFIGFSLSFINKSYAQVSIAPTSLFFNNQNRFSSLTVSNGGQQAQEISISTDFGYPTTENGKLIIKRDSVLAQEKSLAPWIRIFPQSFTLQPNQRQVVRFVAQPPQGLAPGGYWSRVQISSNPVSPPIESVNQGQVGAQINLIVNQVIGAYFFTPSANTGIKITSVNFTKNDNNTGEISVSMQRTGNAPFVGSVNIQLKNAGGETLFQQMTTTSVYTTITRTFNIDISNIDPGTYTVSGTVSSQRRDISQDNLLQIKPVNFEQNITIE